MLNGKTSRGGICCSRCRCCRRRRRRCHCCCLAWLCFSKPYSRFLMDDFFSLAQEVGKQNCFQPRTFFDKIILAAKIIKNLGTHFWIKEIKTEKNQQGCEIVGCFFCFSVTIFI